MSHFHGHKLYANVDTENADSVKDMTEVKFHAQFETMQDAGRVTPIEIARCATDQYEIVDVGVRDISFVHFLEPYPNNLTARVTTRT